MISDAEINALEAWYLHCADTQENPNGGRILALIKRLRDAEKELSAIRTQLRIECQVENCNDWPDDLHLADVIEKHLCWKMAYERDALQRQLAQCRREALELAARICDGYAAHHIKCRENVAEDDIHSQLAFEYRAHGADDCAEEIRKLIEKEGGW